MIGRLGCAVALVLVLAGCGSTQRTQTTTTTSNAGAGQGPTVRFTGGYLPGTVYMGAGPDELSLDAYRLSGSLSKTERLTYSPVGLGIQGLGVQDDAAEGGHGTASTPAPAPAPAPAQPGGASSI